jgi:8-oxo-dGTP pyrophosphatase MutT (NUDIX family)
LGDLPRSEMSYRHFKLTWLKPLEGKINNEQYFTDTMDITILRSVLGSNVSSDIDAQGKYNLASVLIIIYGKPPTLIMIKKSQAMNIHAGEIAFPGGKMEQGDNDILETALRETREEISLDLSREQVIGQLKPVTTLNSGFKIIPYVSLLDDIPKLEKNDEVEAILYIPLIPFLRTLSNDPDPDHQSLKEMYILKYEKKIVWGASARMLKQIADLMSKRDLI